MKIALIVPGGVDRSGEQRVIPSLLALVERLSERHEVHVLVPGQEPDPGSWPLRGATVHNVRRAGWRRRGVSLLRGLHRERPFDVIHALWARGPGEVGWAVAVATGCPLLVHVAGGELLWMPEVAFGARRATIRALARWVLRRADRVTAASRGMIDLVERAGAHAEVVPLGVDTRVWHPKEPTRREADATFRVVHVGSLTPVKDHDTLLAAIAELATEGRRIHLDLVGFDALGGGVQRRVTDLGLDDRVTVHGYLSPRDVVPVVAEAHVMAVSSRWEAGPVAMLEAAAVGVPTVGTEVGHVRDWAPHAALAVPVGDARSLARALATIADDEPRRLALADAARERALAQDADWTASRFEALYAEVC